jgi:hypothetical protein
MTLVQSLKRHALPVAFLLPALLAACTTPPVNPTEDQMADAQVRKCRITQNTQSAACGGIVTSSNGKLPASVLPPMSAPH